MSKKFPDNKQFKFFKELWKIMSNSKMAVFKS